MAIKRYWIDSQGPNPNAITRASEWMMSNLSKGSVGLVVAPSMAALAGEFAKEQPALARTLEYHGKMTGGGATIVLMTESRAPKVDPKGPALVLQATMSLLNQVEAIEGVTKVLAVTWAEADIALWLRTWVPQQIPIPARKRK